MKTRTKPKPELSSRERRRLMNDPQVRAWARRIKGDPSARPHDLNEDQLEFVAAELLKRRGISVSQTQFNKALKETRPILATPSFDDPVGDLDLIFSLPEMQQMWSDWKREDHDLGTRGPKASDEFRKALMTGMSIPGYTRHAQDAYASLTRDTELQKVFEGVGGKAASTTGTPPPGKLELMSYGGAMRDLDKLGTPATNAAMETGVKLIRSLRELLECDRIGKGLLVDCTAIPAWAPQVSSMGNEDREDDLRAHAPEAGFRAIGHTSGGKGDFDQLSNRQVRSGFKSNKVKAWRGYYLAVILDQATGLPLVWTMFDSREQETTAIVPLLSRLFELWPECPAEWIAGDSAFDTDEMCRLCEVEYGIHPIFRLHNTAHAGKDIPRGMIRGDGLLHVDPRGKVTCAAHDEVLDYETLDRPSRAGMRPGQPNQESAFRYRLKCMEDERQNGGPKPCGRRSLPASFDWSILTYYPHHGKGRPDLFAFRQAILTARLGQIESCFQSLKGAGGFGGSGAGRHRVRQRDLHEGLVSLAFLGRIALTVVDQRQQAGVLSPASPSVGRTPISTSPSNSAAAASLPSPSTSVEATTAPESDLARHAVGRIGDRRTTVRVGHQRETSNRTDQKASPVATSRSRPLRPNTMVQELDA